MNPTESLASRNHLVRVEALRALRQLGPQGTKLLVDALRAGPASVRRHVLHALLAWNQSSAALPVLSDLLRHRDTMVRRFAARSLRRLGRAAEGAMTGLSQSLTDPDIRVRIDTVTALGRIGSTGAIREIATAMTDSNSGVRAAARRAMHRALDELQVFVDDDPDDP